MAMQEITIRLSPKMLRELDHLALEKKSKRERVLDHLLKEALRRESARRQILETMARRQASPEWNETFREIKRFRAKVKRHPEKEIEQDIHEAITAVRAQKT